MTEAHLENTATSTRDAYIHDITIGRLPTVSTHRTSTSTRIYPVFRPWSTIWLRRIFDRFRVSRSIRSNSQLSWEEIIYIYEFLYYANEFM